jgi:hypothetical protein
MSPLSVKWRTPVNTTPLERSRYAACIIWQGDCDATEFSFRTISAFGSKIAIEYPISNRPAKYRAASFKRLYLE